MTTTMTRAFERQEDAADAVLELERAGVPEGEISLIAYDSSVPDAAAGAGAGAGVGGVIGGGAGLLAGIGTVAIPGIGPVVAAGWLAATLAGVAAGATAGGLIGALVGAGVAEADAHHYAEGVSRGGALVSVRVEETQRGIARDILDRFRPVPIADTSTDAPPPLDPPRRDAVRDS